MEADIGLRFAKVRLDAGVLAWIAVSKMKALRKEDPYERLRGNLESENLEGNALEAFLEDIVCAVGPTGSSYGTIGRMNASRGAGLLGPYEIHEAFDRVFDLYDKVVASGLELEQDIDIEPRKKDLFLAKDFRKRPLYRLCDPLTGLINGFRLLLFEASCRAKTTNGALLTETMVDRLDAYENPGSSSLYQEIRTLRNSLGDNGYEIEWATNNRSLAGKLGLGDEEKMFVG